MSYKAAPRIYAMVQAKGAVPDKPALKASLANSAGGDVRMNSVELLM